MSAYDPRLTLARPDLAAASLEGVVAAARYSPTLARRCAIAAAGVHAQADSASEQATQLLFGEAFDVLDEADGFAFGQGRRDGYVGYVRVESLGAPASPPTHWVSALRTFVFAEPDVRAPASLLLSMNAAVVVAEPGRRFVRLEDGGWVFGAHLRPMGETASDWVAVAEQFVGAPYHWGSRESLGVDCSGLIQVGLQACGRACPRDSDMQAVGLGEAIAGDDLMRGDLVFWTGHVGVMVDGERLLHSNGFHMATAVEPLAAAVARIGKTETGMPTGYRRLDSRLA